MKMTTVVSVLPNEENNHEEPKKKSKAHRCYFCGQRFIEKNVFKKHIISHKDPDIICEVCGKALSTNWSLSKHMKIHTGERPFKCSLCEKSFIQKYSLQVHVKASHGSKTSAWCKSCGKKLGKCSHVQCWLCRYEGREINETNQQTSYDLSREKEILVSEKSFIQKYSSQVHVKASHGSKTSAWCKSCGRRLGTVSHVQCWLCRYEGREINETNQQASYDLGREKEILVSERDDIELSSADIPDTNKIESKDISGAKANLACDTSYFSSTELLKLSLDNEICAMFSCEHCDMKFGDSLSMQQHLVTHSNLLPYVCQKCGKDFEKDTLLKQHMITHKEDRPYICKFCRNAYKSVPCLRQHLHSHREDFPFICRNCGDRFKSVQCLNTHILIHKVNPFSCETCGKTFKYLVNLQRHFYVHTGERPYQCKWCEKKFSRIDQLKVHDLTHTGERPYQCKFCEKTFSRIGQLKAHDLTHQRRQKLLEESHCNTCGRTFKSVSNYKKHMLLHS